MGERIRISYEDLRNPTVDQTLVRQAEEQALRMGMASTPTTGVVGGAALLHKSWFNLMIAGLIGAFIAWALIEPYFDDTSTEQAKTAMMGFLLFASTGALVGLMIGGIEGVLARNFLRALKGAAVGLAIGFGGGLVSTFAAGIILMVVLRIGLPIVGLHAIRDHHFSAVILFVIARSLAWTVAGMTVGLGPGIALKSKKLVLNGFLGGMIGGAIGGFFFDPINYIIGGGTFEAGAEASRAIGLCVVGATAGLMIGIVEMLSMDAWLLMTAGPLKGKQFIIYKDPTFLGSSPKCEVYLFKDPDIEPAHAVIHTVRDGYELEDNKTRSGTFVNGARVNRQRLKDGDKVSIGEVAFTYMERERKRS